MMESEAKNVLSMNNKKPDNVILLIGIVILIIFLFLPETDGSLTNETIAVNYFKNCSALPGFAETSCILSNGFWMNLEIAKAASSSLKGSGTPNDLAQDIVGFRALVTRADAYPILGPEYRKMGVDWGVTLPSTHPPMAFLVVAPIAFLPWNWASAIWAWLMLVLVVFTIRCFGFSWKVAIGLMPFTLLWPPIVSALGQLTIVWLFALAAGYRLERTQQFWSGSIIGLAALTKFFPGIMILSFLLRRKWLVLIGFGSTFVASLLILVFLDPGAIARYFEVNQINSVIMVGRKDNLSVFSNSYRFGGWIGLAVVLLVFFLIIWMYRDCFSAPQLARPAVLWRLLSYFSVALLPISWVFSLAPLLPIIIWLIFRGKLSTMLLGFFCLMIPLIAPAFGSSAPLLSFAILLIGLGMLIDRLPFRVFMAASVRELV